MIKAIGRFFVSDLANGIIDTTLLIMGMVQLFQENYAHAAALFCLVAATNTMRILSRMPKI